MNFQTCLSNFLCVTKEQVFLKNFIINIITFTTIFFAANFIIYEQHKISIFTFLDLSKLMILLILVITSSIASSIAKLAHNFTGCKRFSAFEISSTILSVFANLLTIFSCTACMLFFVSYLSLFVSVFSVLNEYFIPITALAIFVNIFIIYYSCTNLIGKIQC